MACHNWVLTRLLFLRGFPVADFRKTSFNPGLVSWMRKTTKSNKCYLRLNDKNKLWWSNDHIARYVRQSVAEFPFDVAFRDIKRFCFDERVHSQTNTIKQSSVSSSEWSTLPPKTEHHPNSLLTVWKRRPTSEWNISLDIKYLWFKCHLHFIEWEISCQDW